MDRRTKIIRYVVALLTTLACLFGGLLSVPSAAAKDVDRQDAPRAKAPEIFTGWGFDTCETPSLGAMSAWRKSAYRAVGVYVGGRGRACKEQPNLDRKWVTSVDATGWKILPIYVGSQAPCVRSDRKKHVPISGDAREQGLEEGLDAVASAAALGMRQGSAVYLDMEAYDYRDTTCAATTMAFIRGWSHEVRAQGYLPGFYSSADSGIQHVENARVAGRTDLPEALWFARWKVEPSVEDEPVLGRTAWSPHRRVHQYAGNVTETYGGVSITVDRNKVDAPVAIVG